MNKNSGKNKTIEKFVLNQLKKVSPNVQAVEKCFFQQPAMSLLYLSGPKR